MFPELASMPSTELTIECGEVVNPRIAYRAPNMIEALDMTLTHQIQ